MSKKNIKRGIIGEFKEFISKGNVIDLAVGLIIGSAFTAIVNSLVNDVFMPGIGYLIKGIDFTTLKIILKPGIIADPANGIAAVNEVAIMYGKFIQQTLNFLIIAIVVFFLVKLLNSIRRKAEKELAKKVAIEEAKNAPVIIVEPVKVTTEIDVLYEIRDLLKNIKIENEKTK